MKDSPSQAPHAWQRLEDKRRESHRIFQIRHTVFRHPIDKRQGDFVVIDAPDWVNVLALTPQRELVLVRQWRFGIEKTTLEVPGGVLEAGENPVDGGLRELLEETGYAGERARVIGSTRPNPAIQSNTCHFVFVENVRRVAEQNPDANEEIAIELLPFAEVMERARAGEFVHALALNALFFLGAELRA